MKALFGQTSWERKQVFKGMAFGFLGVLAIVGLNFNQKHPAGVIDNALKEDLEGTAHFKEIGYVPPQLVLLAIDFRRPIDPCNDRQIISDWTDYLAIKTGWVVDSLSRHVRDMQRSFMTYLEDETICSDEFNFDSWKKRVTNDPNVYGPLLTKDFHVAIVAIDISTAPNELIAARYLQELVERKKLPTMWTAKILAEVTPAFWNHDIIPAIQPSGPDIHLFGWAITKLGISNALMRDVVLRLSVGLIGFFGFLLLVFKFKYAYACAAWISVILTVLYTNAMLWPLHYIGMNQTPYVLPPHIGALIFSVSCVMQILEAYHTTNFRNSEMRWRIVYNSLRWQIRIVVFVALANFLAFGINLQSLWLAVMIDTMLIVGTLWGAFVATWMLPSIIEFFGVDTKKEKKLRGWEERVSTLYDLVFEIAIRGVISIVTILYQRVDLQILRGIVLWGLFLIATVLFITGGIKTNSEPTKYLDPDTHISRMQDYGIGLGYFGTLSTLVRMPGVSNAMYRQDLNEAVLQLRDRFIIEVAGVSNPISVSQEVEHLRNPNNPDSDWKGEPYDKVVKHVLDGIEQIHPLYMSKVEHKGEAVLLLVSLSARTSDELQAVYDHMRLIADKVTKEYGAKGLLIEVTISDKIMDFPAVAKGVVQQFPQMFVCTLLVIDAVYVLVVAWYNKRESLWHSLCIKSTWHTAWMLTQTFMFGISIAAITMALCGIPLDMATAVIVPLMVQAGADFVVYPTLFYLENCHRKLSVEELLRETILKKGKPVLNDCLGNCLLLSLLCLSTFSPLFYLGILAVESLIACMLWSFLVLPTIAKLNEPERKEVPYEHLKDIPRVTYSNSIIS
jgi:hypothetical protein